MRTIQVTVSGIEAYTLSQAQPLGPPEDRIQQVMLLKLLKAGAPVREADGKLLPPDHGTLAHWTDPFLGTLTWEWIDPESAPAPVSTLPRCADCDRETSFKFLCPPCRTSRRARGG